MALAAGALSQVAVTSTTDQLLSGAATGGVGPYTYQWYRSTVSGFVPGPGSLIAGATALTLNDSGLIPNTTYFYEVVATDTGNAGATASSAQLTVVTAATSLNPNQFAQSPIVGMIDMRFDYDTIAVQVDASQVGPLFAGQAVKVIDSTDGVPKVVGCVLPTDPVFGFINFDIKSVAFNAGDRAELSQDGNVIYCYATGAISRGAQVQSDTTTGGGVAQLVPASGASVVGWAVDKAPAAGSLIRIKVKAPSFQTA